MLFIDFLPIFLNLTVQYITFIVIFYYLNDLKITIKESALGISIAFIPAIGLYFTTPIGAIIYLFLSQFIFIFIRYSTIKTVSLFSTSIIIGLCSDHMASLLLFKLMNTDSFTFVVMRLLVYVTLSSMIAYGIKQSVNYFLDYINPKIVFIGTMLLVLMIFILYLNIFPFLETYNPKILIVNTLFIIVLSVIFISLISMLIRIKINRYQLNMEIQENENFKSYVSAVESINSDMQRFRHDYLNILLSMKGYIQERDMDGLTTFFDEGILKLEHKTLLSSKVVKTLERLDDTALKGLLFNKFIYAHEQDIPITLEIAEPIQLPKTKKYIDLIRIVGILLDNAIEESLIRKYHRIEIAVVNLNNNVLLIIRNQICPSEFDVKKIFNEGYSTKGTKRGIGLSSVKKIMANEEELSMHYWVEDGWFNVELFIKGEGSKK